MDDIRSLSNLCSLILQSDGICRGSLFHHQNLVHYETALGLFEYVLKENKLNMFLTVQKRTYFLRVKFKIKAVIIIQHNLITVKFFYSNIACRHYLTHQCAKKVMSDSPGLVDFALGLVIFVLNLPDGQVLFWGEIQITDGLKDCNQSC